MKSRYYFFIAVLLVLVASSFFYFHEHHKAAKTPNGTLVAVSPAEQKNLAVTVDAMGTVTPYHSVAVRAMVEGTLEKVAFQDGDTVKANQLLFTIDPRQYEAQLTQAQAKLASDQAQLENARAIVERNNKLLKNGYVAKQDYDTLSANVKVLAATVQSDQAAVANAQLQLDYCTIHAPISGRVGAALVNPGNLVKANDASSLVIINQITPISVQFSLPEDHLHEIQKQLATAEVPVIVKTKKDGLTLATGKLSFVDNAVDSTTGMIQFKAVFANSNQELWPGQFVAVELPLKQLKNAVIVPTRAVQSGQKGSYVYILTADNTVQYRAVEVDSTLGDETAIKTGIKVGEKVVTDGQLNLVDGAKVRLSG